MYSSTPSASFGTLSLFIGHILVRILNKRVSLSFGIKSDINNLRSVSRKIGVLYRGRGLASLSFSLLEYPNPENRSMLAHHATCREN